MSTTTIAIRSPKKKINKLKSNNITLSTLNMIKDLDPDADNKK